MKKILSVIGLIVFALSLTIGTAEAHTNRYHGNGMRNCPMGHGGSWQGYRQSTWKGNRNNCPWMGTGTHKGQFTPKRGARR